MRAAPVVPSAFGCLDYKEHALRRTVLGPALLVVLAAPGQVWADGDVSVQLGGLVSQICSVSGNVFPTAGTLAAPRPLAPGETAGSTIDLENAQDQAIGDYRISCNSPLATVTLASQNGFVLRGGTGSGNGTDISYMLKVEGVPNLASGVRENTSFAETSGPTQQVIRRLLVNVGILDMFDYAPGTYSDQVLLTVEPGL